MMFSFRSAQQNSNPPKFGQTEWINQMYNQQQPMTPALRATLVDADKVLKALNDLAERDLEKFIATIGTEDQRTYELRVPFLALEEASQLIWEIMRDAYSQGPDYQYPETKRRRELRQALRTLNLGSRAVTALLKASAFPFDQATVSPFEHVDYKNSPHFRMPFATQALSLSESLAGKCNPGPKTYNHPQFSKWQKLCAQSKRRIAAIYLDDARQSEARAEEGPASMQKA
jgi:hypothetical protein